MKIEQPHLSKKITNDTQDIKLLIKEINDTQAVVDKLTEGKKYIEKYLKHNGIDNSNTMKKLAKLSNAINILTKEIEEFKQLIDEYRFNV